MISCTAWMLPDLTSCGGRVLVARRTRAIDDAARPIRDELMVEGSRRVDRRQVLRERDARLRLGLPERVEHQPQVGRAVAEERDGLVPRCEDALRWRHRLEHRVAHLRAGRGGQAAEGRSAGRRGRCPRRLSQGQGRRQGRTEKKAKDRKGSPHDPLGNAEPASTRAWFCRESYRRRCVAYRASPGRRSSCARSSPKRPRRLATLTRKLAATSAWVSGT